MTANPRPLCECEFDRVTGAWKIGYFNCPSEEAEKSAIRNRIEQITTQVAGTSGLTNRERTELSRERDFLNRHFLPPDRSVETPKAARKEKAAQKKLLWLTRKEDEKSRLRRG